MLIKTIKVSNFLSLKDVSLDLLDLSVLIGRNNSGKSNVVKVLEFLQSLPMSVNRFMRERGGIKEWVWNGEKDDSVVRIEVSLHFEGRDLTYSIDFTNTNNQVDILHESIKDESGSVLVHRGQGGQEGEVEVPNTYRDESMLGWDMGSDDVIAIRKAFSNIRTYSGWNINGLRHPQPNNLPSDFLMRDGRNLPHVIQKLIESGYKGDILMYLKEVDRSIEDICVSVDKSKSLCLSIREKGIGGWITSYSMSEGLLRYLCLLSIFLHPVPPPLICVEMPETGLHPDVVLTLDTVLQKASQHTQVVITTHSDSLLMYLKSVLVCTRQDDGSTGVELVEDVDNQGLLELLDIKLNSDSSIDVIHT